MTDRAMKGRAMKGRAMKGRAMNRPISRMPRRTELDRRGSE